MESSLSGYADDVPQSLPQLRPDTVMQRVNGWTHLGRLLVNNISGPRSSTRHLFMSSVKSALLYGVGVWVPPSRRSATGIYFLESKKGCCIESSCCLPHCIRTSNPGNCWRSDTSVAGDPLREV